MDFMMLNWQKNKDFYVLDTETTGLGSDAQIVELGLIDQNGKVIIDTLVKPISGFIPPEATAIHGITTEKVMDLGVDWGTANEMLFDSLVNTFSRKDLIIYNADYDVRLIEQTSNAHDNNSIFDLSNSPFVSCAMLSYAEYFGRWDAYRESFKWQSLINACKQQNVKVENAHRAVADCQMTLSLIKAIWAK
jgi:DNA polymerase III epsilon subunit-like protein